jgi:hypothetical protein
MADRTHASAVSSIEEAIRLQAKVSTRRFRWRVRDCVFCSWRELSDEYSMDEMWELLMRGRYVKAVRLKPGGIA